MIDKNAILSTLLHLLEFAAVIIGGIVIVKVFNLTGADAHYVISGVLYSFSVYARKAPNVPVKDWVNPEK